MKKNKFFPAMMVLALLFCFNLDVLGENDNDSAQPGNNSTQSPALNGYIKGAIFCGANGNNDPILMGHYGEMDLKTDIRKQSFGRAFADLRLDAGDNRGSNGENNIEIRELWAEMNVHIFTFRIGRQIIVWGRADSVNPTDNITPMNGSILSSEYDDTRIGNQLIQCTANISSAVNLNCIWVPAYKQDVLSITKASLPAGISIGDTQFPSLKLNASSYAARLNFSLSKIDGSISYYNGYNVLPGFDYSLSAAGITLLPTAYRMQAIGGDFSTALGNYGLRGEICAKLPDLSSQNHVYVPAEYIQYVFGLDRTIGDFNILVQYSGLTIMDCKSIDMTDPTAAQINKLNRLFTGTLDEISHALTGQVGWDGLSETLHLKLAGMYIYTTSEYVIYPTIAYDISDALTVTGGGRYMDGPNESLDHQLKSLMNNIFVELKSSF